MSGSDINNLFQLGITNFTSYLSKMFNITLRSVTNSVKNYYKNLGTYDNKTQKELYYMQCEFKFSGKIYSKLPGFELVKQYGWFNPKKNNLFGATRDHMVSRNYGWTHKIDPEIICHPANCQIMLLADNSSKGAKCSITLQELLERIEHWEE